jgi:hypothetical protein
MAIVSLNIGNLTLEVNTLKKNKLVTGEKEKAMLQDELDEDRFPEGV